MPKPETDYVQIELPYLYCDTCGRKDYRVALKGSNCMVYNSAPAKYPEANCLGIMTTSTQTLAQRSNHGRHDERSGN